MHSPWEISNWHLLLRLLLSVVLGGLIGFERERKNHAAGLRTHTLVCLGSCLIMVLSIYGFSEFIGLQGVNRDPARLAAQAITGIGFLGAGTIMFTGKSITGLTTAASLWVVMAIGLSVGAGFYAAAAFAVFLALIVLWGLNVIEQRYVRHPKEHMFTIMTDADLLPTEQMQRVLNQRGAKLLRVHFDEVEGGVHGIARMRIRLTVRLAQPEQLIAIAEQLRTMTGVSAVSAES